jgi:predicted esterase
MEGRVPSAGPVRTIETVTHGRYLLRTAASTCVLVGFHGYGESAEDQFTRLTAIPGSESWMVASIQGLHRFYERRTNRVVASWMTREDRDLMIADNLTYTARVLEQVLDATAVDCIVFAGFSQGVAMAFRAAVAATVAQRHVIAVGGDVPPELDARALGALSSVLICRGADDQWYSPEKFDSDLRRLTTAAVDVEPLMLTCGHEWGGAIGDAAGRFLAGRRHAGTQAN